MGSRIKWVEGDRLRILNNANLDCIFEMVVQDKEGKPLDVFSRHLKLISVVKVDNLYENLVKLDSQHMFFQRLYLAPKDVLERLIRMNQNYKTGMQHAFNFSKFKEFKLLEQINKIDYT